MKANTVGIIEGGDKIPVTISSISYPTKNDISLYAGYNKCGLIYDKPYPDHNGFPKEIGIDYSLIPNKDTWIVFPTKLDDTDIIYEYESRCYEI